MGIIVTGDGGEILRGAKRTIAVIKALNLLDVATVSEISKLTQISRQAVYRILATLIEEGLAARQPQSECYRLQLSIRSLSAGYRDEDWVLNIAAPIVNRLQKEIVWPTNFATFNGRAMIIRHTSRRNSPLVIDKATVGLSLPLLETAMGLAFLAWCVPEKCSEILANLAGSNELVSAYLEGGGALAQMLTETRERGYATRPGNFMPETRSISVPVLLSGEAVGALAFTFFTSSVRQSDAVKRYLPALLSAQRQLHEEMERMDVRIDQLS